jgi:hypothetical protein
VPALTAKIFLASTNRTKFLKKTGCTYHQSVFLMRCLWSHHRYISVWLRLRTINIYGRIYSADINTQEDNTYTTKAKQYILLLVGVICFYLPQPSSMVTTQIFAHVLSCTHTDIHHKHLTISIESKYACIVRVLHALDHFTWV